MNSYPPLRLAVLQGLKDIKDGLQSDPSFLENEECPYDEETVRMLKDLLATKIVEKEVIREVEVEKKAGRGRPRKDAALSEEDQDHVKNELKKLIDGLNALSTAGQEASAVVQITRTKATLIEKLLQMQERIYNVKKMSEFQTVIISILDDLVDEKGREIFLKRLEPYR